MDVVTESLLQDSNHTAVPEKPIVQRTACEITKNFNATVQDDLADLRYYIDGVLSLIIITLGLIGNSLTIVVLTRRMMHSSTNCYLTALAVWDSLVLIITLFLISLPQISPTFAVYRPYVVVYIYPLGLIAQTATIWLTLSFTVERYIAVCHPLRSAGMCTIQRARYVIFVVCIASVLYNIVRWFDFEIVYACDVPGNTSHLLFRQSNFSSNEIYQNVYYAWMYPLMMSLIPLVSLMILNTFLILAVRTSREQRSQMNVRQSRENNVTIMLVSVVVVFIICQIPAMVYNVAQAYLDLGGKISWEILSVIRNFLVNLNSAINFMLYCTFGQKFRRIFVRTFCACAMSEEEFNSITHKATNANVRRVVHRGIFARKQLENVEMCDNSSSFGSNRDSQISRHSRRSEKIVTSHDKSRNGDIYTKNKPKSPYKQRMMKSFLNHNDDKNFHLVLLTKNS